MWYTLHYSLKGLRFRRSKENLIRYQFRSQLMVFKTWFSWIRGNDKIIIGNLEKQGEILVRATSDLVALITNYDKNDLLTNFLL